MQRLLRIGVILHLRMKSAHRELRFRETSADARTRSEPVIAERIRLAIFADGQIPAVIIGDAGTFFITLNGIVERLLRLGKTTFAII